MPYHFVISIYITLTKYKKAIFLAVNFQIKHWTTNIFVLLSNSTFYTLDKYGTFLRKLIRILCAKQVLENAVFEQINGIDKMLASEHFWSVFSNWWISVSQQA